MKKRLMIGIIFFLTIYNCYSQLTIGDYNQENPLEKSDSSEQIYTILAVHSLEDENLSEHDCLEQMIFNTDSVYSFFQSRPFKPIEKRLVFFEVEDEPIPYDTIIEKVKKVSLLNFSESLYKDDSNKKIPFPTLLKMILAASDSTTQYTVPIRKWNAAELGEEWLTRSNHKYYDFILDKNMAKAKKEEYKNFLWSMDKANRPIRIKMSIPVFDEDYKYAFMVFKMNNNTYDFAIFIRDEIGWIPYRVSKAHKISNDFSNY
ncbi:hypothetical protein [Dysgonomonas sp. 25]|uniref:hypothetical protein n=1 Tax=Dysgonomonas sp. 25 TaxID=2302933 RepID=UPI0013D519B9|nr:hypothetical protein [Dysgonomonas sp. 25]NDV68617.1 hypothetical protein [Dysgonomonas sp. 25]